MSACLKSFLNGPGKPSPSATDVIICARGDQCAVRGEVLIAV